jgi:mannose-1-phosphate guanylyltransferase
VWIARQDPRATVAVLPADHFVWQEERFARHVWDGLAAAEYWPRRLILLGVEAEGPETGYGWIAPGAPVGGNSAPELYAVRRFWEKPDRPTAVRLFGAGSFWNTLVLAGSLEAYFRLAAVQVPDVLAPLRVAAECMGTPVEAAALSASYARIPPTSLSRALLARCPQDLMMLAARGVCWGDWGEPARILRTLHRFDLRPRWLRTPAQARLPATARL